MPLDPEVQEIMARLNKKFGAGTLVLASEAKTYDRFPSGSLGLDLILGGGWPVNVWNELVGEKSAGKTNLAFATIAANQKRDPNFIAAWVAAETFVPGWADAAGVDRERLILIETNVMEEAYDTVLELMDKQAVDAVVIDSLPALMPAQEDDKDSGEMSPGRGALLNGQFFRKAGKAMKRSMIENERPVLGLIINQYRLKIGVSYGDPRTTPGGQAKDYWYFTQVELARDEWIEVGTGKDKDRIGQVVRATAKKNKSAPPQQVAKYDIYFDEGGPVPAGQIDFAKEIVTLGAMYDVVEKAGSWRKYAGMQWQGNDAMAAAVREDIQLREQLEREVLQVLKAAS